MPQTIKLLVYVKLGYPMPYLIQRYYLMGIRFIEKTENHVVGARCLPLEIIFQTGYFQVHLI